MAHSDKKISGGWSYVYKNEDEDWNNTDGRQGPNGRLSKSRSPAAWFDWQCYRCLCSMQSGQCANGAQCSCTHGLSWESPAQTAKRPPDDTALHTRWQRWRWNDRPFPVRICVYPGILAIPSPLDLHAERGAASHLIGGARPAAVWTTGGSASASYRTDPQIARSVKCGFPIGASYSPTSEAESPGISTRFWTFPLGSTPCQSRIEDTWSRSAAAISSFASGAMMPTHGRYGATLSTQPDRGSAHRLRREDSNTRNLLLR